MEKNLEFELLCHFCAVAKKRITASNLIEAKQIAEADYSTNFEEIIRLTEPCKVDEIRLLNSEMTEEHPHNVEYKSWGAE